MLTRRLLLVVAALSLLVPAGSDLAGARAGGSATGFKGSVSRLPDSPLATEAVTVLAINPNRATVKKARPLNENSSYRMTVRAGLYMVGGEGLGGRFDFTHAIRLRRGQMRTVDLPPRKGVGNATSGRSLTSSNAGIGAAPVVTVGPITAHGIPEFNEGADLWWAFNLELGSRPRCKVDYTSDRIRELAQQEIDFQQSHDVDPETRITPNFVTPTSRVSGTMSESDGAITISLTETDIATGDVKQSESVSGPKSSFFELVESIEAKVGRNLCPPSAITGTIDYTEVTSFTTGGDCCIENESIEATIGVAMRSVQGDVGYEDDGSTYTIQYSRSSSGSLGGCNYQGTWSGTGNGANPVAAGKLVEPGETSPSTGLPATMRELLVGVDYGMEFTQSGSETYSGCDQPENNATIPHPETPDSLDQIYQACESSSGYLEFTGDPGSNTLTLNCSVTDGDTTYTLDGTLTIGT